MTYSKGEIRKAEHKLFFFCQYQWLCLYMFMTGPMHYQCSRSWRATSRPSHLIPVRKKWGMSENHEAPWRWRPSAFEEQPQLLLLKVVFFFFFKGRSSYCLERLRNDIFQYTSTIAVRSDWPAISKPSFLCLTGLVNKYLPLIFLNWQRGAVRRIPSRQMCEYWLWMYAHFTQTHYG